MKTRRMQFRVTITIGIKAFLTRWPLSESAVQWKSRVWVGSIYFKLKKMTVGVVTKHNIQMRSRVKKARLIMNSPRAPVIFFHRMSVGSVAFCMISTALSYMRVSSSSSRSVKLKKVDLLRILFPLNAPIYCVKHATTLSFTS